MKWLHNKKGYKPEMLKEEEPMAAIRETFRILQGGVNSSITQETPPELTAALTENVFVFSGFKEHHELVEASRLLTDQNGDIKPFNRYLNDVRTLHEEYNKNYLRAEYNFAVRNSQMAVKWKEWEETGDRYLLQYRTAGDDRVRETHAVLDGTTLPMDDPFWDKYLPPLGWNCRCTTVQVRRGKYPESDSKEAVMKGENCTASVKQQIFRFNPGKVMKVFPPKHPYLPKGCGECQNKGSINLVFDNEKAICKACRMVDAASVRWSRERVREHFQKQFNGKSATWNIDNTINNLTVSYQDIKTLTGKAHEYPYARNMSVYYLKKLLMQAEYIGNSPDIKGIKVKGHGNVVRWHYFKIPFMGQKSFLVIKETDDGTNIPHHIQDDKHFDFSKIKNRAE